MAEQPHARLYNGLPPAHPVRRRWLIGGVVGAVLAIAGLTVGIVTAPESASSHHFGWERPRGEYPVPFDRYALLCIVAGFLVGGALGLAYARGWWSLFAVDAVGLAVALGILFHYGADVAFLRLCYGWFFWVLGASAGLGGRRLRERRRIRAASFRPQLTS